MKQHDSDLRSTLRDEERRILAELPEHGGILSLTGGAMKTKMRPFILLHIVLGTIAIAFCVFAVIQVFGAETTKAQILWALAALGSFTWVGLSKVYFWMQLERRAIVIEVKRAEIRILEALKRDAPAA
jgi:hypothetical protein